MRRIWIVVGVGAAAILIGIVGFGVFKGEQQEIVLYPELPPANVVILSPAFGDQFELGSPVVIEAFANAAEPIASVELWIDGQLMGLQEITEGASAPYTADFVWSPQNTGVHVLVIRVLGSNGPLGFSDAVHVAIIDSNDGFGPANDNPGGEIPVLLPITSLEEEYHPPEPGLEYYPPDPGEVILPAVQMEELPDPGNAQSSPDAPILFAEVDGCSVAFTIHDLSENEIGFHIYRQASSSPILHKITTLEAGVGQGWLNYTDSGVPGGSSYVVAAFNAQGESPSNPVLVNVTDGDCPSSQEGPPALSLDLGELLAGSGAEQAYCYQSLNGRRWNRVPAQGFLFPGEEDQTSLISLENLLGGDSSSPMSLTLECWGWLGGALELLGTYQHEFELESPEDLEPQIGQSDFTGVMNLVDLGDIQTYAPMGGEYDYDVFDFNLFSQVHDPSLPIINTYISYDPDVCQSHLMPDMQNLFGTLIFCAPYPGYDSGNDGDNPQPYLIWDMGLECGAGYGTPPCHPYGYWESLASDLGGNVWFRITDTSSAGTFYYNINAPELFALPLPPVACSGTRTLHLTMYYGEGLTIYFSIPSNLATVECSQPLPWEIPLQVTFDDIRFWALDDGDDGADDIEVYGYIKVAVSGGQTVYINLAKWGTQDSDCPDETGWFGSLDTEGALITGSCTKTFGSTTYDLADVAMCHGTSKTNCSIAGWDFDHNSIQVLVTDWSAVTISYLIYDWDDASAVDLQCNGSFQLPARDRFEWAQLLHFYFESKSLNLGNGGCELTGTINAVVP